MKTTFKDVKKKKYINGKVGENRVLKGMAEEIHVASFGDCKSSCQLDFTQHSASLSVCLVKMVHAYIFPLPPQKSPKPN